MSSGIHSMSARLEKNWPTASKKPLMSELGGEAESHGMPDVGVVERGGDEMRLAQVYPIEGGDRHHVHAGGVRRRDAGRGVLERDAERRIAAQALAAGQIQIGRRLGARDLLEAQDGPEPAR